MPHFIAECTDNIREQADLPLAVRQSQRGAGRHRHLSDRRDPQPRPLAGYLADGRRQAGLRLRAYDPEDRRRAQPESRQDVGDMLFALINLTSRR